MRRLALAACIYLAAAHPQAAETWTYGSSDHFEVYTTGGDKRARAALAYFERVHTFFADFLKLDPQQRYPTRLIVFSNDREYAPYRPQEGVVAFYAPGPDRDYIVMRSMDAEAYPIVVHEYAHLIVRHSGSVFPLWLDEGLAEYFSTIAPVGGKVTVGQVPVGRLTNLIKGPPLMPLDQLFGVTHDSPEYNTKEHMGQFYAESWALTHMVMTDTNYFSKSSQFLAMIGSGTSSEDTFQAVYNEPLATVFGNLRAYLSALRYTYFETKYREPKTEASFVVRPVDAFEGRLTTATLLAEGRSTEVAARAALGALTKERPDDLALVETEAYFELRHGHEDAAKSIMARAVALGSKNASLHRDYARFVSGDEAVKLLEIAVNLEPEHVDTRLRYASALLGAQRGAAALDALKPLQPIPGEQAFIYLQIQAKANLQIDNTAEARAAAARAVQYAAPGREAEYATQLLQNIETLIAQRAEVAAAIRSLSGPGPVASSAARTQSVNALQSTAVGRFTMLECSNEPVVVEVTTTEGVLRLVIDNPDLIRIAGGGRPTIELTCGEQDANVRVSYVPNVEPARRTVGSLRLLQFVP